MLTITKKEPSFTFDDLELGQLFILGNDHNTLYVKTTYEHAFPCRVEEKKEIAWPVAITDGEPVHPITDLMAQY